MKSNNFKVRKINQITLEKSLSSVERPNPTSTWPDFIDQQMANKMIEEI